jgi:hypothetical protein
MPQKDDYADQKLRSTSTVKGLSRETMDAVKAGEAKIDSDHPQAELLKQQANQRD